MRAFGGSAGGGVACLGQVALRGRDRFIVFPESFEAPVGRIERADSATAVKLLCEQNSLKWKLP